MRVIDLATWPRRRHFETFSSWQQPHANICAPVDVTALRDAARQARASLFASLLYAACHAANEVPELRQRVRDGGVVEHDVVHPSFTITGTDGHFRFCRGTWDPDPRAFFAGMGAATEAASNAELQDLGDDDRLYVTSVPWVAFTSIQHAMPHAADSVPRIAWGKVEQRDGRSVMPLSLQVHHAVADGVHMGRFFAGFEDVAGRFDRLLQVAD